MIIPAVTAMSLSGLWLLYSSDSRTIPVGCIGLWFHFCRLLCFSEQDEGNNQHQGEDASCQHTGLQMITEMLRDSPCKAWAKGAAQIPDRFGETKRCLRIG